ncbi:MULTISPECIES: uroporphyrinogen-III C-methyltransferase [Vibrio]|uniref:uroporphyrinogen-III C-methyltransferase n=1 Tax=Vibrio TaxID=662 RepID=UPI0001B94594|nr:MULTISPECIES: uroporphyrinogen-III C-methyltransferase [Vibrio]EEX35439.1 HemX-like protein [Vibrio coralliilyticus ATCC BAA-450]MCM5511269.1 uroporphyrinogen-III C-methyltransferase [Vibrio sp. SCSIO 43169]MDE3900293.1 uroporphyrinogen-III C-methyltransferase [Vibrio sp. CC007]NRF17272.1 uroporphyrinogen-III C-methyltransferase [Vibrio coralliilyticus]QFT37865.1 Putative uroporphyrinogen-III C-methyltransferase [Vibrio sp. THAF64]
MTSKNKNDHIEPEKDQETASSAETHESSNNTSNASESPSTSSDKKSEPTASTDTAKQEKNAKRGVKLGAVAIVISLIVGGGLTFQMQQQNAQYQSQIEALKKQLEQTTASVQQDLTATQQATLAKATEITHNTETVLSQQQKSIESLQLAIADVKGRRPNDWLLAEADYLVKLAGRKLFLEHDAVSATKLMESADQRIAALNDPSLVPLRKSMANDITKLKSVPIIDREGLVLRLTALQQQVDSLPLANAILPEAPEQKEQQVSEDIYDWKDNLMTSLKDFSENFITFRTRDGNVIPLLSPEQHFYLKENIKAKLETAIKAVYVEQQDIYQTALTTADKWSSSFFNQDANTVIEFNKTLEMLSKQNVQVDYPVKLETQQILSDVIRDRLRREVTTLVTEEK